MLWEYCSAIQDDLLGSQVLRLMRRTIKAVVPTHWKLPETETISPVETGGGGKKRSEMARMLHSHLLLERKCGLWKWMCWHLLRKTIISSALGLYVVAVLKDTIAQSGGNSWTYPGMTLSIFSLRSVRTLLAKVTRYPSGYWEYMI